MKITGKFDVKLTPSDCTIESEQALNFNRMLIEKTFHGELSATSTGEMLSAMTGTTGSAGYVAQELVTGKLEGKQGSFVLQHFGLMDKGADSLTLVVVPDSGTNELSSLKGDMQIAIEGGEHFYTFDYTLA